jgi:Tfp pilus assembly protein PilF
LNNALIMLQVGRGTAPLEIEGQLLAMRLAGLRGDTAAVADNFALIESSHPEWAGQALAEAAEGLAQRAGPVLALDMLRTAPGVDFSDPRYAAVLRAIVRFSHQAGEPAAARVELQTILVAQPDSSAFQAIRGLDLELSGAPAEAVRAAYARALELEPGNARALAGLGRLALGTDPEAAFGFFDRAASADPSDPEPKLQAARALVASGKLEQAESRLDALLLEHPFEAEAAAERARLDVERGIVTPETLERARRAVRFGGGADALELLSRVHAQRDDPELAARAAEAARAQREAEASEG